jgi:hypothetical protein
MLIPKQTAIPALVRVKPGALDRVGVYAKRHEFMRVLRDSGVPLPAILLTVLNGLKQPASRRR